jgi:superoxide reductase
MSEAGLFCKVNRAKDPTSKEALEQKHSPCIKVPDKIKAGEFFNATIRVGEIEHPNGNDHFIQWIELYVSDVYLGRFDFAPVMTRPEITIPLQFGHTGRSTVLRAVTRCNLHGVWESSQEISIQ